MNLKHFFCFLLLIFLAFSAKSQYVILNRVNQSAYSDGPLYLPLKDTTFTPTRKFSLTMRPQDSTKVYIWDGHHWNGIPLNIGVVATYTAGYGLNLSSNVFKADTTKIANFRIADSIAYASGINYQTIAEAVDTAIRNDAASMIRLSNGKLLKAWNEYTSTPGDGSPAHLMQEESVDGGFTWTNRKRLMSNFEGAGIYVPSLDTTASGDSVYCIFLGYPTANTTVIWRTAKTINGSTWSTPVALYTDSSYLGAASHRIFTTRTGKKIYPFYHNTNPPEHSSQNGNYTGKALVSTNGGAGWFLSSITVTSPDSLCAEPGMFSVADSMYYYWRTRSGFVYCVKSTDDYATIGSVFKLGINAPNSQSSIHYIDGIKKLIAVSNEYIGNNMTSGTSARRKMIVSYSPNVTGVFQRVLDLDGYQAGYGFFEPDFIFDQNKFIFWYSKNSDTDDSTWLKQAIVSTGLLLQSSHNSIASNYFSWRNPTSTYVHSLYSGAFTASRTDTLQNIDGTTTKQLGIFTSKWIPFTSSSGALTGTNDFTYDAANRRLAIGGGTTGTLNVKIKASSDERGIVLTNDGDANNYMELRNGSSGSVFIPQIDALIGGAANQSMYITPQVLAAQDAGTAPALRINAYKNTSGTLGALSTKPILGVYNNTTLLALLTSNGNLGLNGTPTFLNGYTNGLMFSGAYPVIHLNASGTNAKAWQMGAGTYSSLGVWELYGNGAARMIVDENGRMGLGGVTAVSTSSMLQINSTNAGVLLPRMTKVQRDAISSPAQGLIVFVTDNGGYLSWYNSGWQKVSSVAD